VPAVARGIAILRPLIASERPFGVRVIACALGLVPTTCLHILHYLPQCG
jgi:DNA-binding IclR family transcriptional regulator